MAGEQLIAALSLGCIYALVALGYSLVFASIRLLDFARGDLVMLGGFIALAAVSTLDLGLLPLLLIVMLAVGLVGFVVERFIYRKIPQKMLSPRIMCTLGIGMILRNLVILIWGPNARGLPPRLFDGPVITLLNIGITPAYYLIIVIGLCIMVALTLFLGKTRLGLAVRTSAFDPAVAELMGMNTSLAMSIGFTVSAAIAGAAGLLVAPITFISFSSGLRLGVKAFAAAVLGGLGSIPGGICGGFLLGLFETFGATIIGSGYKDVIAFLTLIIVLVLRPAGLLGQYESEKV